MSATPLSSNQTYARREPEISISARIRTTEAALQSLRSEHATLQKFASLEEVSQKAKDELEKRLSKKNKTQDAQIMSKATYVQRTPHIVYTKEPRGMK